MDEVRSYLEIAVVFIQANSATILNILGVIVGVLAGILLSRWGSSSTRERNRVAKIGRLTRQIREKEHVFTTPNLHATLMDRQSVIFSFFTLVSAMTAYLREVDAFKVYLFLGVPLPDYFTWVAFATGAMAMVVLVGKWTWSSAFVNFDSWIARRQSRIDRLQKRSISDRTELETTDNELEELEKEDIEPVAEEIEANAPAGDRFGPFLRSRIDMRFVLSKNIDDGKGDRPWQVGIIKSVGTAGFGFISERIVLPDSGNLSAAGPEYYFSYSNLCTTDQPEVGDEAFFISISRDSRPNKRPPAYLVCLRGKKCRGLVRQMWSKGKCFVEIVDGSENYASVLALLDRETMESGERMEVGDSVEGTISHNQRGIILRDVKRV